MKRILIFVSLVVAASLAQTQDIAGDWQGALSAGGQTLHLVLHLTKTADNNLKATIDSLEQEGANGIPVASVTLKDSKLTLDAAVIHATYDAKVSSDAKTISGTWAQGGQTFPLEFKPGAPSPSKPSDIDGSWMGTLDLGTVKLRVVFNIHTGPDGLSATLDSPDQGAKDIPTSSITRDGSSLKIEIKKIEGLFEGKIAADLSSIDGTFTQLGAPHPLILKPVKDKEHQRAADVRSRPSRAFR